MCGSGQHDIAGLNTRQFFENGAGGIAEADTLLPQLKAFPQHEGQKADQDMSLNAIGALMPDRAHPQLVFLDPKSRFGLGQLDVGLPELFLAPVGNIRTQEVGAF